MVSGVFSLDNTDEALLALQVLYPFEVKNYTDDVSQINIK
jgi:ferric-dicitrate binding protein FerR (iron transport regulator)